MLLHRFIIPLRPTRPLGWPLFGFFALYLLAILFCRSAYYRDPTSAFFQPDAGYRPIYSSIRQQQAEAFIDQAAYTTFKRAIDTPTPKLCLGIRTIARKGTRYFRTTVGSLFEGLSDHERQDIVFIPLIAQTRPELHPAYQEAWLYNVADTVLRYDLPEEEMDRIRAMEEDRGLFVEKALFDHTYLFKACEQTGAPYILMVEDDVVAVEGWYHRANEALGVAEVKTHEKGRSEFLYLRLFYTEKYFGWNSEDWPTYLFWSLLVVCLPAISFGLVRRHSPTTVRAISGAAVTIVCFVCIPMCIILFFAVGRNSLFPLQAGVSEMPRFGCCFQSIVFPRFQAAKLIEFYETMKIGFVDTLTEEYADTHDELRFAITPSLMQHIGATSSKENVEDRTAERTESQTLWNFRFEEYSMQPT